MVPRFLGYSIVSARLSKKKRVYFRIGIYENGDYTVDFETPYFDEGISDYRYSEKLITKFDGLIQTAIHDELTLQKKRLSLIRGEKISLRQQRKRPEDFNLFSEKWKTRQLRRKWLMDDMTTRMQQQREQRLD